ncbi:MAG: DUF1549 domain-containing protein [Planctomycetota bacterium]|nr:MAG: DUF1549 domain-containing protein [Planctomycetota bacterium]
MRDCRRSLPGRASVLPWAVIVAAAFSPSLLFADVAFETDVAPLLVRNCVECHSPTTASGGLILTTSDGLHSGGDSGPVLNADEPLAGYLLERVVAGEMPPPAEGEAQSLPEEEIRVFREWIAAGAPWPEGRTLDLYERTNSKRAGRDWWSLQPVIRPDVPSVKDASQVATPIDAFIVSKLDEQGWRLAREADRPTLIRRLYFDLIGLPPSAEEVDAFLNDESDNAYEQLVDRLLASPHFGERWARYWLDMVRYADTCGYERDQEKPGIWKYRDWVVDALNKDMPYDEFVTQQLAGDEIPDRDEQSVIATGFLRLGTWNDEPNDPQEYKYERLEDMVHATSSAFLAMTVKCARCHDHKFDPIPQTDYYRMASTFWAGYIEPRDREWLGGPRPEELGFDVFGWTDRGRDVPPLHRLKNGDPAHPAEIVEPAQLSLVTGENKPIPVPPEDAATTHRRLHLAEWITDDANPLTARVMVNRLWLHHFGEGLVRSPDNFGFNGDRTEHPKLLDWLADELMHPTEATATSSRPWSAKRLHKLIVMSAVYRQSADHELHDEYAEVDSSNRLWWHKPRRRLDADAMRDSLLTASGRIDLRMGGPSFRMTINPEALEGLSRKSGAWQPSPPEEQNRRSLYLYLQRSLLPPLMTTFDQQDTTLPCAQRDVTTVAPQALALLNNEFIHEQSLALAARVIEAANGDVERRIRLAWRFALGRDPSAAELRLAAQHLAAQRERFTRQQETATDPDGPLPIQDGLALSLIADEGVQVDESGRVIQWTDNSAAGQTASQQTPEQRPLLVDSAIHGQSVIRFDGQRRFLHLGGAVLTSQPHSVIAVATDEGSGGHREIFSNWNGAAGNTTTSVFLGTTGDAAVRFSDAFVPAGSLTNPAEPFVISAVAGESHSAVFQNGRELARQGALPERNLATDYVVGQQGNIDGEYWTGDIAALLVYDRELTATEREQIERWRAERYGIEIGDPVREPAVLALESLCHVLLNTNEFLYVD